MLRVEERLDLAAKHDSCQKMCQKMLEGISGRRVEGDSAVAERRMCEGDMRLHVVSVKTRIENNIFKVRCIAKQHYGLWSAIETLGARTYAYCSLTGSHVVVTLLLSGKYLPVVVDNFHNSKPHAIQACEEIALEALGYEHVEPSNGIIQIDASCFMKQCRRIAGGERSVSRRSNQRRHLGPRRFRRDLPAV
jgi:hypothetical protein